MKQEVRFIPVQSQMQKGVRSYPAPFGPSPDAPHWLSALNSRFIFHHHDLCLFHQATYRQLLERDEAAQRRLAGYRQAQSQMKATSDQTSDDDQEWQQVILSRMREDMNVIEMETQSIKRFSDHHLAIACWVMVEHYAGRTLIGTEGGCGVQHSTDEAPHRWSQLASRFAAVGVDVGACMSHDAIDECRVLNNKIKHLGTVDDQLAKFAQFKGQEGARLETIELPLQKYIDGVYDFVMSLFAKADEVLPKQLDS